MERKERERGNRRLCLPIKSRQEGKEEEIEDNKNEKKEKTDQKPNNSKNGKTCCIPTATV